MIKVNNLDKYFNKGKNNEIHVINNTSLEFPKKGLVTLIGASGSGKTTLLNVIGGLDKSDGEIVFNGNNIGKFQESKWDSIRSNEIGYIFQNYHLLESETVYINIEIVLNMIGIKDQEEKDYKINYILESVGMIRYKNKFASDLSGGQKQRVAIARALVKNPDVIIADEPTGNLDSNNSIEILQIIKEISKEKLVILVTHNIQLANYFSDRIITISDGVVVNDVTNNNLGSSKLEVKNDNIYLDTLNKYSLENVKLYLEDEIEDIDLTIVKKGDTFYLQTKSNVKVELLKSDSKVKLVDKKPKEKVDLEINETSFSIDELEKISKPRTKKASYTLTESFKDGVRSVKQKSEKDKIMLITLLLIGVLFTYGMYSFLSTVTIDKSKLVSDNNTYFYRGNLDTNYLDSLINDPDVTFYRSSFWSNHENFSLGKVKNEISKHSYLSLNSLPNKMIESKYDLSKLGVDDIILSSNILKEDSVLKYYLQSMGYYNLDQLLGQTIQLTDFDFYDIEKHYTIKGFVDEEYQSVYFSEEALHSIQATQAIKNRYYELSYYFSVMSSNAYTLDHSISLPTDQDGEYGIVINSNFMDSENPELIIDLFNRNNLKVVGFYTGDDNTIYLEDDYLYDMTYLNSSLWHSNFAVYSSNQNTFKNNQSYQNVRDLHYDYFKEEQVSTLLTSLIVTLISIVAIIVILYLLARSSITQSIKEISILRSLGLSKNEVRSKFLIDNIVTTAISSFLGLVITTVVILFVKEQSLNDVFSVRINVIFVITTIIILFFISSIISVIPVNKVLKKTPAEMLTNYDL